MTFKGPLAQATVALERKGVCISSVNLLFFFVCSTVLVKEDIIKSPATKLLSHCVLLQLHIHKEHVKQAFLTSSFTKC